MILILKQAENFWPGHAMTAFCSSVVMMAALFSQWIFMFTILLMATPDGPQKERIGFMSIPQ
jgi:hypothetical protein